MWSKLLHTATGHVQKLNDCKGSEWQANGLLWECEEALWRKLCGCAHCLLGDICNIIVAHHWVLLLSFFLFWGKKWYGSSRLSATLSPYSEYYPVFSEMELTVWNTIALRLFPSLVFTSQRTITLYYMAWPKLGHTHTHTITHTDLHRDLHRYTPTSPCR